MNLWKNLTAISILLAVSVIGAPISTPPPKVQALWDCIERGHVKEVAGDIDGAIAEYTRAIALDPNWPSGLSARAEAKLGKGDFSGAIVDYGRLIAMSPSDTIYYIKRAGAKVAKGDLGGAIADYGRAILLSPQSATTYNDRGLAKQTRGDLPGAIADYSHAILLEPQSAIFYKNRSNAKKLMRDPDGAVADFDHAIKLNPRLAAPSIATPPSTDARSREFQPRADTGPTPKNATKEVPFVNSLGMTFAPVEITGGPTNGRVFFSIWDTRVQDYTEFAHSKGIALEKANFDQERMSQRAPLPPKSDFAQGPTDPAVSVSWLDAKSFCAWLTAKERAERKIGARDEYRLPSDHEWSCAAGIGRMETPDASPESKAGKIEGVYPWGSQWPPANELGNYGSALRADSFRFTSPVGRFPPNEYGLYDMGGNVWQWCDDWYDAKHETRVRRGASWLNSDELSLRSAYRCGSLPSASAAFVGFRCMLVVSDILVQSMIPTMKRPIRPMPPTSQAMASAPRAATKGTPFTNSLGMKFAPVEIAGGPTSEKRVLFSIFDTRVRDYAEYARAKAVTPEKPHFDQEPTHPVVSVTWDEAKAFCAWLSEKERASRIIGLKDEYRLPADHEWSCAVGIGRMEKADTWPGSKGGVIRGIFPWGPQWPPPKGYGNYSPYALVDDFQNTSPVGSFPPNENGLFDMGGNVLQWCEDWRDEKREYRVLRGASFGHGAVGTPATAGADGFSLLSSCRQGNRPQVRGEDVGFRCVLVVSGE
jgi:formylglycine-generating enzyme required for sulfatase activity